MTNNVHIGFLNITLENSQRLNIKSGFKLLTSDLLTYPKGVKLACYFCHWLFCSYPSVVQYPPKNYVNYFCGFNCFQFLLKFFWGVFYHGNKHLKKLLSVFVVMCNNWFVWFFIYFSFVDLLIFIVTKLEDLIWHESNVEMSWPSPWARNESKSLQRCRLKVKPRNHILCS